MLSCARAQWLPASLWFVLAACFRSNGLLLGGFIIWGLLVQPFIDNKRVSPKSQTYRYLPLMISQIPLLAIPYTILLTALPFLPLAYHNYSAYTTYCLPTSSSTSTTLFKVPEWCTTTLPSIYTHVQRKYWHSGFLAYWTPAQIPNFSMAAPVYALLLVFCGWHLASALGPQANAGYARLLGLSSSGKNGKDKKDDRKKTDTRAEASNEANGSGSQYRDPFLAPSLTPHAIHALVLTLTVLFSAHVQIMLRQAASMPTVYWAAAWLFMGDPPRAEDTKGIERGQVTQAAREKQDQTGSARQGKAKWGRMWVGWSVVWGAVSLVLWVAFLPPA